MTGFFSTQSQPQPGFSFSSSTQSTPGFGFGSSTSQPSTGFAFGSSTPSTQPSGFSFGTPTTTSSTGFGFGSTFTPQSTSGFSFGSSTSQPSGFAFGSNQTPQSTAGFTFMPSSTPQAQTGFSFGTSSSQPTSGFSFGTTTSAQPFGFGSTSTTGGTGFSFGSTSTPGAFSFPAKTTTSGFSFGGNTGSFFSTPKTTVSSSISTGGFKGFGVQSQPLQTVTDPNVALYMAVCAPAYFNDERDEVLKKWNQLQAIWGNGKGYYAQNAVPVEFTPENPFCRFKAVGYIKIPSYSNEDGFIELIISRKDSEVKQFQQQIVDTLSKAFNNCQICVDYVQPLGQDKTQMSIYVQQRSPSGETKKAPSWDVYNHLNGQKQVLSNLCIESCTPLVALTESQLKEYLETPPRGVDPMIWEQGKRANPDPKKYLPVVMIGFQELRSRFKYQEEECRLLQGLLDKVASDITQLQAKQSTLKSHIEECKRKQLQMAHRVLKLVVRQEVERKRGVPIEQGEEHLRMLLESLQAQLTMPTQYMGRLNELLSQMSVQQPNNSGREKQDMTAMFVEKDLHQFLSWQQDALKEIMDLIKKDSETVTAVERVVK